MGRILILANNDVGLYKFRKEVIEELLHNNEVYISSPYGDMVFDLKKMGCNYIHTPVSRRGTNPVTDFKLFLNYLRIIKQVKPDVCLTYTIKPNVYGGLACRIKKIPYIANITGLGTADEARGLLQQITLLLFKLGLKGSKCVFFQNEENQLIFKNHAIVEENYKLIPGSGVNLDHFNLFSYPKEEPINFLFISRVMKSKGIDHYLEAAKFVTQKYPEVRFHVLGSCEEKYEDKLKQLQSEGIIQYHGMQKDVKQFLKDAHCTIHPTYYPEGMSNILLESAAIGRPIITTNRSGCREIVDDGVNGYLVAPKDSQDLIEKIERFLGLSNDEKNKMGLAGRRKVVAEFDREIVVDAYLEEVKSVVGEG